MFKLTRTLALAGALCLALVSNATAQLYPSGSIQGNAGASAAPARAITPTAWLDRWCGSTAGFVPYRGASSWGCAAPGATTGVQPYDADLTAIAGLTSANNKCFYWTGSGTAANYDCTSFGRGVSNAADATALRVLAGTIIGTDVQAYDADLAALAGLTSANNKCFYWTGSGTAANYDCTSFGRGVANAADASALRTLAGAIIGTDVQAYDAELAAIAGLTSAASTCFYFSGSGTAATFDCVAWARSFIAAADISAARTSLGVAIGTNVQAWDADLDAIAALSPSNDDVIQRKAGVWASRTMAQVKTDLALVKGDVGLGNVDNTSDATKFTSPTLTGTPLTPTAAPGTNTTQIASTAFVAAAVVAGASGVASIAGNTGAFTLGAGLTNNTNDILLLFDPGSITNCTLTAAVAANALTVALKTRAGADPDATHPCIISFRSATAVTGDYTAVLVTAATSFATGTSGSSFGASNATPFKLWITAFNNAGTVVLGVSNQTTSTTGVLPINEGAAQSSTACNACTNASAAGVYYTTATQTSKAIRILGYMEWGSGLGTAGSYVSGPTTVQLMGPGVPRPGTVIQVLRQESSSATATTSSTFGNSINAQAISPTMASNLILVSSNGVLRSDSQNNRGMLRLARGATQFGGVVNLLTSGGGVMITPASLFGLDFPGTTSSTTYNVQVASENNSGTVYWGDTGANNVLVLQEIMGALPEPANDNINPGVFARAG